MSTAEKPELRPIPPGVKKVFLVFGVIAGVIIAGTAGTAIYARSATPGVTAEPGTSTTPTGDDYVLLDGPDGDTPASWAEPCSTVHYAIDTTGLPGPTADTEAAIRLAVERYLGPATGTPYVYDGLVDTELTPDRPGSRNGTGADAPLVIGFSDDLGAKGGVTYVQANALHQTATVVLDPEGWSHYVPARSVDLPDPILLHELGHAAGLDHFDAPGQVMNRFPDRSLTDYAPGDLTGLSLVGCRTPE